MVILRSLAACTAVTVLWAGGAAAQEACSSAPIRDEPFECLCAGGVPTETVWGSNPYTADSGICAAAFHAGVIAEDGGLVTVLPSPGLDSYLGSLSYGIESRDWGPYDTSFEIMTSPFDNFAGLAECSVYPFGEVSHACTCPPYDDTGAVWGSGPYTGDSSICLAAMHAGSISDMGGEVNAIAAPGLEAYRSSEANGVVTREWGSYPESFIIDMNF